MKRTPQPNLTQSKLTSMLQTQARPGENVGPQAPQPDARRTITLDEVEMETADPAPAPGAATAPTSMFLTTDLFLKAMKENREQIIGSFNATIESLSRRIDTNDSRITSNTTAIKLQSSVADANRVDIAKLAARVDGLERDRSRVAGSMDVEVRATLSPEYMLARRSIRMWPVAGITEEELWQGVGDFIHDTMAVGIDEVGQGDIEEVKRVDQFGVAANKSEVLVTFFDKRKRDLIMTNSPNLADRVDGMGRPTAGLRIEVPLELKDTFRLLTRFGARLRARHGPGTKRHIKFDDYEGSLFANIKLPGDQTWTRVTAGMAREDLRASLEEEGNATQKRLASKLIPGPRERLGRPMAVGTTTRLSRAELPAPPPTAGPSGKRPRWSAPDRDRRL